MLDANEQKRIILLRKRAVLIARERGGFLTFCKLMFPKVRGTGHPDDSTYVIAAHHELIASDLENIAFGVNTQLIQTLPPRHGKSKLVSHLFVAWYIGLYPDREVVVATYNEDFAGQFGSEIMRIIQSPQYQAVFPGTVLRKGGQSKTEMATTAGGKIVCAGRGSTLTGLGAHLLIIDDVIKNSQEANSKTIRDEVWDWMINVAFTRRMGDKAIILTWTRWHPDDPIGRLVDKDSEFYDRQIAEDFIYRNYPAICVDSSDGTGRKVGEALWPGPPNRLDLKFLNQQRHFDPRSFEALYQGNPVHAEGDMFKAENIKLYDPQDLPAHLVYYAASDHAVSTNNRADFTVLLKGGVCERGHLWLTDCWWDRAEPDQVIDAMILMGCPTDERLRPIIWFGEDDKIFKSFYPALVAKMRRVNRIFHITKVTPSRDKVTRANSIAAMVAMGMLHLPRNAPWTERAIAELTSFPGGKKDDWVDTVSHLGQGVMNMHGGSAAMTPEPVEEEDYREKRGMSFKEFRRVLKADNKPRSTVYAR